MGTKYLRRKLKQRTVNGCDRPERAGGRSFNRQGNKSGIAALRLEIHQIGGSHLAAFSRKLQKSVLMNLALDGFYDTI